MKITRDRLTRSIVCKILDDMSLKDMVNFISEDLEHMYSNLSEVELLDQSVDEGVLTCDEANALEGKLG